MITCPRPPGFTKPWIPGKNRQDIRDCLMIPVGSAALTKETFILLNFEWSIERWWLFLRESVELQEDFLDPGFRRADGSVGVTDRLHYTIQTSIDRLTEWPTRHSNRNEDRSLTSLGKNQKNRSGNPRGAIKNAGRCHRKSIFSQALTVAALIRCGQRERLD